MEYLENFGDIRQTGSCIHCGGATESKDHSPSLVLLDKPHPKHQPWAWSCEPCNRGFSLDEEYLACVLECAKTGSVRPEDQQRDVVSRILRRQPRLTTMLEASQVHLDGKTALLADPERIQSVVLKLARGHAAYELNEPQFEHPDQIAFVPLDSLVAKERERFETPPPIDVLPEIGSRAMQRVSAYTDGSTEGWFTDWVEVQPGRYRYLAAAGYQITIRIVMSEYLACEVIWNG